MMEIMIILLLPLLSSCALSCHDLYELRSGGSAFAMPTVSPSELAVRLMLSYAVPGKHHCVTSLVVTSLEISAHLEGYSAEECRLSEFSSNEAGDSQATVAPSAIPLKNES